MSLAFSIRNSLIISMVVLVGCTVPATPSPTAPPESVTLKLSWLHSVEFLGFYIAQEQGYYADEGLSVSIEPILDPAETDENPAQVAAGEIDFSTGGRPMLLAQSQGAALTSIALITQLSPLAYFARADSGIVTPADLAGHSVPTANKTAEESLKTLLETVDLTLADVETVPGSFDMTPFFEGDVDVWFGFLNDQVVRARLRGLELVTFPLYEYGIEQVTMIIYTSQQMVQTNSDLAVRFVRASLLGWEWALDHPVEAVDIMLARFPELADEREFHQMSFDAYIPLVRPPGTRVGTIDCQRWISDDLLVDLDSTEGLCTTSILEAVWGEDK